MASLFFRSSFSFSRRSSRSASVSSGDIGGGQIFVDLELPIDLALGGKSLIENEIEGIWGYMGESKLTK